MKGNIMEQKRTTTHNELAAELRSMKRGGWHGMEPLTDQDWEDMKVIASSETNPTCHRGMEIRFHIRGIAYEISELRKLASSE